MIDICLHFYFSLKNIRTLYSGNKMQYGSAIDLSVALDEWVLEKRSNYFALRPSVAMISCLMFSIWFDTQIGSSG